MAHIQSAIHYWLLMAGNAWVIQGWTQYDHKAQGRCSAPALRQHLKDLCLTCMQGRVAAFVVRRWLRWRVLKMALPPSPATPTFKTLLRTGSSDMIGFYEKLKEYTAS